jgi:hypothetical protein
MRAYILYNEDRETEGKLFETLAENGIKPSSSGLFVRQNIQALLRADRIIVLSDWLYHEQAKLEAAIAQQLGLPFYDQFGNELKQIEKIHLVWWRASFYGKPTGDADYTVKPASTFQPAYDNPEGIKALIDILPEYQTTDKVVEEAYEPDREKFYKLRQAELELRAQVEGEHRG